MPTKEEIALIEIDEELARRRAVNDFGYFVKLAWPTVEPEVTYTHNWHVDAIGLHLVAVLEGRIKNIVINMPPRMSKSSLVSVMFPAWVWLKYPGKKFLFASYADSLSVRDSIKCRALIESDWYRNFFKPEWSLKKDQNRQDEFTNTRGGYRIATSVDGSATGKGGDIVICDDPHNANEIYSDTRRTFVTKTWWDGAMSTRSIDPMNFARIIVMQRLHIDDLSGHVLKRGGYDLLKLPMEYEGNPNTTSIGWSDPRTEIGELLSPNRFGPDQIVELKRDLGSHGYAGQEQQEPKSFEGGVIKRLWFKFYKELPWDVVNHTQAWDFAASEKNTADYTCGGVAARKMSAVYFIDWLKARMEFPAAVQAVRSFSAKNPRALKKKIENKSNGAAVIQTLKSELPGIVEVNPRGDKLSRLTAVSPFVEAGNVYLPEDAPWVNDFLNEICGFAGEGSGHDDQVDVFTMLLDEFASQPILAAPMGVSATGGRRGY